MQQEELIPHLFREEYRKIVSVLCKRFGFEQMEIAEDIASDTFVTAAQTWPIQGIPKNPIAWLYNVAKNKSKNYLLRDQVFRKKIATAIIQKTEIVESTDADIDLSPQNISDSQLQMMFAICHPSISTEAQIGLSLRILCGFGINEIADAFLANNETINKRLFRAREKLREEMIRIEIPNEKEMEERLEPVLLTLYLLFSEGYYSSAQNETIRKELCFEAMRLCTMLTENETTNRPEVNALLSLMCFHSSRLEARIDKNKELILYDEQNTNLWNEELIARGAFYMNNAAKGNKLSRYHLEAAIAYWHTQKTDTREKWENILQLYNKLLQVEYSPLAALNRTFALAKANSKEEAIVEAEKLQLFDNQFYYVLLGELYIDIDNAKSKTHFEKALALAKTSNDKKSIQKKLDGLQGKMNSIAG